MSPRETFHIQTITRDMVLFGEDDLYSLSLSLHLQTGSCGTRSEVVFLKSAVVLFFPAEALNFAQFSLDKVSFSILLHTQSFGAQGRCPELGEGWPVL